MAAAGGRAITAAEPRYGLAPIGLAPIGLAHPDRALFKSGAEPGDALVLAKASGTGAIPTAAENGARPPPRSGAGFNRLC